jgi:hypothetical protein
MPDRADGAATGLQSRRSHAEAAFTGLRPAPHPVAALSLSVALGRDPAVAPTPHAPAVNRCAGRVTSLEKLYPGTWLTFNTLCKQNQGWIESRQGANNPSPGSLLFAVQKASRLPGPEVFAFVGLRNVVASYRHKVTFYKREHGTRVECLLTAGPSQLPLSQCAYTPAGIAAGFGRDGAGGAPALTRLDTRRSVASRLAAEVRVAGCQPCGTTSKSTCLSSASR